MKPTSWILISLSFLSLSAVGGDWEEEFYHLDAGNRWLAAANEESRYVARHIYVGPQPHTAAKADIDRIGQYLGSANEHFKMVNRYRSARNAPPIKLYTPRPVRYRYHAERFSYRTYPTLVASAGLGSSESVTSSSSTKSADKGWKFVGCYSQADAHDRCRARFENDKWCHDSHLGTGYECLSQEKTAPRACYCWR